MNQARAQSVVLSPQRNTSEIFNMSEADPKENAKDERNMLKFSKNIINANVRDVKAMDLSFVDLPGVTNTVRIDLRSNNVPQD